jgi:diguanylate cyclase (GGDEF)-like protein
MQGDEGLRELLERAGSERTVEYLDDVSNWISVDESTALFQAAAQITGDAQIARRVGEESVAQHAGTPVATLLRSLGSPEEVYRQMALAATKFSTVSELDTIEVAPGRALIRGRGREGFVRTREGCDWAQGLMSQATVLFGLPPALVQESSCQARGDAECLYDVTWDASLAARMVTDPAEHIAALEAQLGGMTERLERIYATATDLIAETDLGSVLARITERAATAVRAPRFLLALRPTEDSGLRCHYNGFEESEARELARNVLASPLDELPATWLAADVSSTRRDYGRLVAMSDSRFFPQERSVLELYARYAATALDGATALAEAQRGHAEASALLELARKLAEATTSDDVAARLAEAVPTVVDCDRVSVWLWDPKAAELTCRATSGPGRQYPEMFEMRITPEQTPDLPGLLAQPDSAPLFYDLNSDDEFVRETFARLGTVAMILAPIVARGEFLGTLSVTVDSEPARLEPRRDLLDRLSGIVAQAASALQTGRLLDRVTHQARHDGLTGLANRSLFTERMDQALEAARESGEPVGLFFVDLDGFKAVNDGWGHPVGDELLCQVAGRLLDTVRTGDTVARLGGDEFAIVLSGVSTQGELDAAAERVALAFELPFEIAGDQVAIGASVGRATWPEDASEIEALMRHADAEMYRAKRSAQQAAG